MAAAAGIVFFDKDLEVIDGTHVNAHRLCDGGKKEWKQFYRSAAHKEYIEKLALELGIPARRKEAPEGRYSGRCLIESARSGHESTWIHYRLAYKVAAWLSPDLERLIHRVFDECLHDQLHSTGNASERSYSVTLQSITPVDPSVDPHAVSAIRKYIQDHPEPDKGTRGFVYILKVNWVSSRVKIGMTQHTIDRLQRRYRTAFPSGKTFIYARVDDARAAEAELHYAMREHRIDGEWFRMASLKLYTDALRHMSTGVLRFRSDPNKENTVY